MPDLAKLPATPAYPPCIEALPGFATLDLSLAFPTALRPLAAALTAPACWHPAVHGHHRYQVMLDGEVLTIPSRIYVEADLLWANSGRSALERSIACSLGTRHHNGYVREACLTRLLAAPQPWMAPFIVQLVGEYVDEIVQGIETALPTFAPGMRAALAAFVRDNPRYLDKTESRSISYRPFHHNVYCADYAGKRVVAWLRALGRDG